MSTVMIFMWNSYIPIGIIEISRGLREAIPPDSIAPHPPFYPGGITDGTSLIFYAT